MKTGSREKAQRWIAAHPDEWRFIERAPRDTFAGRLSNAIRVFGSLTDAQLLELRTHMRKAAGQPVRRAPRTQPIAQRA